MAINADWIGEQLRRTDADLVGFQEVLHEEALRTVCERSGHFAGATVFAPGADGASGPRLGFESDGGGHGRVVVDRGQVDETGPVADLVGASEEAAQRCGYAPRGQPGRWEWSPRGECWLEHARRDRRAEPPGLGSGPDEEDPRDREY